MLCACTYHLTWISYQFACQTPTVLSVYACTYLCIHVCRCMYLCIHVCRCMYLCIHVCQCMYVCIHVRQCMYVCMYTCPLVNWQGIELIAQHYQHTYLASSSSSHSNEPVRDVCQCMYVCVYTCLSVYVCMYTCLSVN